MAWSCASPSPRFRRSTPSRACSCGSGISATTSPMRKGHSDRSPGGLSSHSRCARGSPRRAKTIRRPRPRWPASTTAAEHVTASARMNFELEHHGDVVTHLFDAIQHALELVVVRAGARIDHILPIVVDDAVVDDLVREPAPEVGWKEALEERVRERAAGLQETGIAPRWGEEHDFVVGSVLEGERRGPDAALEVLFFGRPDLAAQ